MKLYGGVLEEAIHALHYTTPAFDRALLRTPAEHLWQKTLQDALKEPLRVPRGCSWRRCDCAQLHGVSGCRRGLA